MTGAGSVRSKLTRTKPRKDWAGTAGRTREKPKVNRVDWKREKKRDKTGPGAKRMSGKTAAEVRRAAQRGPQRGR